MKKKMYQLLMLLLCVGMLLGKHKLAPVLSPKKSIEGSIGGIVGSAIVGALFGYFVVEQVITSQQVTWVFAFCSKATVFLREFIFCADTCIGIITFNTVMNDRRFVFFKIKAQFVVTNIVVFCSSIYHWLF